MAELTDDTFKRMAMGKVFKDNTAAINSVDFSGDGEYVVTSSDDESIRLYSCAKGEKRKTSYSKKYGVGLVRFTHHSPAVICASKNKWDETLRYLSLHDNQYIRYFRGHRDKVVCMDMCPKDDTFLSASLDRTVRLWDLRSPVAKGLLNTKEISRPCAKFDPSGLIFVAATKNKTLKLFDVRAYDKGPFATFNGIYDDDAEITAMDISADGKHLLVSTNQSTIYMIDAFDGSRQVYFKGHTSTGPDVHATFSPDAKYVLSGSETGKIHVWEASTGRPVATLEGHPQPTKQVRCNPTKMMLASACQTLAFWIPAPTGRR